MSAEDYGTDIGVEYNETSSDVNSQSTDLTPADGLDNLYQAIQNRLLTPIGTLPLHPTYGSQLHTLIGKGNSEIIEMSVKMMVVEALQPESRIAYIRNIDVDFTRTTGTITVIIEIVSIYSQTLNINLAVGA